MKTRIAVVALLLFSFLTQAQANLDSLYMVWQDETESDSIRTRAFVDYIWDGYLFMKPDTAFILAEELKQYILKNLDSSKLGTALYIQANSLYLRGQYDEAIDYHRQSLNIDKINNNQKGVASSYNAIALLYDEQGYFTTALNYYKKSLKIRRELDDQDGIATSLVNISKIYSAINDYDNALNYLFKALNIFETLNNKIGIASTTSNIGNIFRKQKLFDQSHEYLSRSLAIHDSIRYNLGKSYLLNNFGSLYVAQGLNNEAEDAYKSSLVLKEELNDVKGIGYCLMKLGEINVKMNRANKAISYCLKSKNIAEKINALDLNRDACDCLYNAYKINGNLSKALLHHEAMLKLEDSLNSEEAAKTLQQMEFEKQVLADSLLQVEKDLKKDIEHQQEVNQKEANRNMAIGASIFLLFISGGLYGRWRYVKKSKAIIEKEKDRSDNLLLNILPSEIAEELKEKGSADARDFDMVSILFTDFKGFTQASEKLSAQELIKEINECFKAFDHICEKHKIEKIKTIGDAYMAAGGLPVPSDNSVKNTVLASLEMQDFITKRIAEKEVTNDISFKMRLGIHTGPVVAGIVGVKKFQYDIWGDTVNTAARMESSGEIGKVNVSEDTYNLIKDDPQFQFENRGKVNAKGKGEITMYFVSKTL